MRFMVVPETHFAESFSLRMNGASLSVEGQEAGDTNLLLQIAYEFFFMWVLLKES
jgi:hypothetical protein